MFGRFPAGTVRDLRRFPYDIFTVLLFKVRECFLRSHLRQTTAAAHAQLDAIVGSFVSLQDYGRYLQHLLAFREPIETAVLSARPLEKLNKRMTVEDFRQAAEFLKHHNIDLRVFILLRPPFQTEAEGLEWACHSLDVAAECGATVCSLIPTRGGNGALEAMGEIAVPGLIEALHGRDGYLRPAAADMLQKIGSQTGVDAANQWLNRDRGTTTSRLGTRGLS